MHGIENKSVLLTVYIIYLKKKIMLGHFYMILFKKSTFTHFIHQVP